MNYWTIYNLLVNKLMKVHAATAELRPCCNVGRDNGISMKSHAATAELRRNCRKNFSLFHKDEIPCCYGGIETQMR